MTRNGEVAPAAPPTARSTRKIPHLRRPATAEEATRADLQLTAVPFGASECGTYEGFFSQWSCDYQGCGTVGPANVFTHKLHLKMRDVPPSHHPPQKKA